MEAIGGKVLYLPSNIPRTSIIYKEKRISIIQSQMQWVRFTHFDHPVLVLRSGTQPKTVVFLPIITLPHHHAAISNANSRLVWPRYVLIDQVWCSADIARQAGDRDFHEFPNVRLAQESLRVREKLWVLANQAWEIELEYLLPYPVPRPAPCSLKTLPNPPVYLNTKSLNAIYGLAADHQTHPICVEPQTLGLARPPDCILSGHIYRLPLETTCSYLQTTQEYSFYERPLGRPFLVTGTYDLNSTITSGRVTGFVITNFNYQPIGHHFCRQDSKTRWIRAQYLPIEGVDAEIHDDVPAIELAAGSPQLAGRNYVHCLKDYVIDAKELLTWTAEGEDKICVDEGSVNFLNRYSRLLQEIKEMKVSYFERAKIVKDFIASRGDGSGGAPGTSMQPSVETEQDREAAEYEYVEGVGDEH